MKMKTRKSIAKRFKITSKKKILHRSAGQDHFNSSDKGKVTRSKRKGKTISKANQKSVRRAMPYS
jgi:large subunit ribosomal protein L35